MATRKGLEPSTSGVTGRRSNQLNYRAIFGGNNRARTCDIMLVRHALSQLSYAPLLVIRSRRRKLLYKIESGMSTIIFYFFHHIVKR